MGLPGVSEVSDGLAKVGQGARAVEKAAETVVDDGGKVVNELIDHGRKTAETVVDNGNKVVDAGTTEARKGLGSLVKTSSSPQLAMPVPTVPAYAERLLTDQEKSLAMSVFSKSLPFGAVYLSNGLGLGQRPYTIPHPLHAGAYVIHIGPDVFPDATNRAQVVALNQRGDEVFIHELTHVWQGTHRKSPLGPFDYVIDSLYNQTRFGFGSTGAYDVNEADVGTKQWNSFSAEQQGMIVQHWFVGGMLESAPAFRYIRDNIRAGNAYA